ncbi:MAG: hypothetical protein ABIG89_03860 [Candidatus Woesearchaeota archaeon]
MQNLIKVFNEKNKDKFHLINRTYRNFEEWLLRKGFLLSKPTTKGYWAGSSLKQVNDVFKVIWEDSYNELHNKPKSRKHKVCRSFCDLGSGDGRIVLTASLFGIKKAVGIEMDPWLHNVSLHMKDHIGLDEFWKAKFIRNDFAKHNIKGYDYVFIAPDRPFHRGLEDKFRKELNGKLIVNSRIFQPNGLRLIQNFDFDGNRFCVYDK